MYLVRTPRVLKSISPNLVWEIPPKGKELFLTFDDGPVPEVTPQVLDILAERGVKATFFCVGANVERHPEILADILDRGHSVGNHTFDHVDGWKIRGIKYYRNFLKGASKVPQGLFRPPYGRKLVGLPLEVERAGLKTITWDVADRAEEFPEPADYARDIVERARPGSIILIHPMYRGNATAREALPMNLAQLRDRGYDIVTVSELLNHQSSASPQ